MSSGSELHPRTEPSYWHPGMAPLTAKRTLTPARPAPGGHPTCRGHTCSVRLRASRVRTSSPALASSSLLSFSSRSVCSSSWDRTAGHGGQGGGGGSDTRVGATGAHARPGRTFSSDSRLSCSIWKASCSFTRATSSWLCCVTVSCLAVSAFCAGEAPAHAPPPPGGPTQRPPGTPVPPPTFLSSSACVLMSSLCFSLSFW